MSEEQTTGEAAEDYPRGWRFDEDGPEVSGKFVKFDVGQTKEYGSCPIIILNVNGEERSVWCFHQALRSKFQQEVHRRDLEAGETVFIRQVGEKKSGNQRNYMAYVVQFPDAPPVDAKAIFGPLDPVDAPPVAYAAQTTIPVADADQATDLPVAEDW